MNGSPWPIVPGLLVAGAGLGLLIVHPHRQGDQLAFDYEFRLDPARTAVPAA